MGDLPQATVIKPKGLFTNDRLMSDFSDNNWNVKSPIDALFGADVYHSIVTGKNQNLGQLTFISTLFGLAVSGPIPNEVSQKLSVSSTKIECLSFDLERFWNVEEIPAANFCSDAPDSLQNFLCKNEEEKFAEEHFLKTYATDCEGRIITTMPFFKDETKLGNSYRQALLRFENIERKLEKMPKTYELYREFMKEFLDLKHMELVPVGELDLPVNQCYYIPHHCVAKEDSTTTKLRVVFDASAKTTSGISLNDCLAAGPKLQDDLFHIMIRFRFHKIATVGDIAKMYRQVSLDPCAKDYHRLFWRNNKTEEVRIYRMCRVTYGVKSASHSSIKALQIISSRSSHSGARRMLKDLYVDDMISGSNSIQLAREELDMVCTTLHSGGFEMRKIGSSEADIVNSLPAKMRENVEAFEFFDEDHLIKTLGIAWQPMCDAFEFKVAHLDSVPESNKDTVRKERIKLKFPDQADQNSSEFSETFAPHQRFSRRQILSDLAKVFDPLGLLSPGIVRLKICMQEIWQTSISWDDPLPEEIVVPYLEWRQDLRLIRNFRIERRTFKDHYDFTQIHVFCDASTKAYGAVIYVRQAVHNDDWSVNCKMLTSKCKVAPVKQLTVPKLELCAALTGVRLLAAVRFALRDLCTDFEVFAWSDSTTVLHWLGNMPGKYQTFVANRVAQIQEVVPRPNWYHIPTELNPADLCSRGMSITDLLASKLWWRGPEFLHEVLLRIPVQPTDEPTDFSGAEEKKLPVMTCHAQNLKAEVCSVLELIDIEKFSCLTKLLNLVALVYRFVSILRKKRPRAVDGEFVVHDERRLALCKITIGVQQREFFEERSKLVRKEQLSSSNRLAKLYPFLDEDGVMRVGGRLHALTDTLSQSTLYPAILPKKAHLSWLIATKIHKDTLHGGLHLCMAELRRSFWVISSRQLFRDLIHNCVRCFRFNSKPKHALMGDLPKARITPSRPFDHTGVDFAGPIGGRCGKGMLTQKWYLAIFVCFSTKAVHIEVVSSLTTEGCIAAIHRFAARRGVPSRIYSDNGTNFMGSKAELARLRSLIHAKRGGVVKEVGSKGMEWVVIPPASPNFGGLWEAAVKSAKAHLKKVVGKALLTFEELATLCCDIESMMNSRPLAPISDDPKDLGALTPFMLLTGAQSASMPTLVHKTLPSTNLEGASPKARWLHLRHLSADFWKRWGKEYLTTLQQRPKHARETPNLEVNDLVLVTDERLAPLHWPLGRITHVFPGNDGQVRTVNVQTETGVYKRPAFKTRKLPVENTLSGLVSVVSKWPCVVIKS